MLEKITIIVLLISNVLLWVSHIKMKMIIGLIIKTYREEIKKIMEETL